ncbi:dTDP-4-dehydrorhamnose reductase [Candidatus Uabimicrobium amorphum]|uniref:dTDP-4-dehydrorhamnose reductase n=1 Tax=Uabimicrobium amorphum TaxID=2596890 RepID=A0A5S9IJY6_UABAM|nr:dTDP-4-dehydrorhamnose reductase [Candidatus Uabimicrobium amorphum]BBM82762.1 NAD(P)-dependent oxidoreductase [Candidatus Uabimicrobium amorphum]
MQKVIVTGSGGMVGTYLIPLLNEKYDVHAFPHSDLDVTDVQKLTSAFEKIQPQIVVHLAAMTNVDLCEEQPQQAFFVNEQGTKNIAKCCRQHNCTLLYVSTGMVFDGNKTSAYEESDCVTRSVNIYGESKYKGEQAIQQLLQKFYIVRTTWLFGGGQRDKKFVAKMLQLGKKNDSLSVVDDTWGSPTYTKDLSAALETLCTKVPDYGIYHIANVGRCNRLQFAQKIFADAKMDCTTKGVRSASFPTKAPRPFNESITSTKLSAIHKMRTWQEALHEYVTTEF